MTDSAPAPRSVCGVKHPRTRRRERQYPRRPRMLYCYYSETISNLTPVAAAKSARPAKFRGLVIFSGPLVETLVIESVATAKPALRKATAYACLQGGVTAWCEKEFGIHPARVVLSPASIGAWLCGCRLRCDKRESRQDGGERQSFRSQCCLRHPTASSFPGLGAGWRPESKRRTLMTHP